MPSEFHWWGLDTQFTAAGDDASVTAVDEINQRIVRELLTPPGDYLFQPSYGAGLGRYIGRALSNDKFSEIKAAIRSVVARQPDILKQPGAQIAFQNDASGLVAVQILYTYAPTGQAVTLTIPSTQ